MLEQPKYSIVIAVHDQSEKLELNLPKFFTNQGDANYEVIVVNDASVDETPDVLTRMKNKYSHLYTTFLPISNVPIPSRLRLALSVGVKASHGEWVILSDINRPPVKENWLEELPTDVDDNTCAILIYDNNIQSFQSMDDAAPMVYKAERRSAWGHRGHFLRFQRGLYSVIMVRKEYAQSAIQLFDHRLKGGQLMGASIKVLFNNLF